MRTGIGSPVRLNGRFDQSIQQKLSAYGPVAPSPDCLHSRTVRPAASSATVLTVPLVLVLAGWVVFSLPYSSDGTCPVASEAFLS